MEFDWDSSLGLDLVLHSLIFAFIAYLMVLFSIIIDLFWRDLRPRAGPKAIWVIFLIVFPYITALVYLIARGKGMAERSRDAAIAAKRDTDTYIREAAGTLTGTGDRRREGASRCGDHHPAGVRLAEGQGARLASQPGLSAGSGPIRPAGFSRARLLR